MRLLFVTPDFDEHVQDQLAQLQAELAQALTDDDYAGAAWAQSAMLDLHRRHAPDGTSLSPR